MIWGRPRLSADIDVTAEIELAEVPRFLEASRGAGFEPRTANAHDFVTRTRVLPLVHSASGLPVDIVLAGPGLEEEFLDRAVPVKLGGVEVPVLSAEDLVVTKILAGRAKDIEDVRGILAERWTTLDLGRVRRTLSLLDEALGRSDLLLAFEAELPT